MQESDTKKLSNLVLTFQWYGFEDENNCEVFAIEPFSNCVNVDTGFTRQHYYNRISGDELQEVMWCLYPEDDDIA